MDYLNSLSGEDQIMLAKYRGHLECVRTCIDRNQAVIREILRGRVLYPTDEATGDPSEFDEPPPNVRHGDMDQVIDYICGSMRKLDGAPSSSHKSQSNRIYVPLFTLSSIFPTAL